jgi:hypothetical protein
MLRHFGLLRNPEVPMRLVDGRRAGPTPFSEWGRVEFSLIETHLSCKLERTHDNRHLCAPSLLVQATALGGNVLATPGQ